MFEGTALGIDLGTSSLKLVLIDAEGHPLHGVERPLLVSSPFAGASEQAPEDWWDALDAAMAELRGLTPAGVAAIASIGLSGQMHGLVCLGADDAVLRPAMLWNDNRARLEAGIYREDVALESRAGLRAAPGLTACKLAWLRTNEPDTARRTVRISLCKDYLRLRMTGEFVTDPCDAAGTLLFDEAKRQWSDESLDLFGLQTEQLPRVIEGPEISGRLLPAIAARWGIDRPAVVIAGAGDGAAGAIGIGLTEPGRGFISLGTSAQISIAQDFYAPAPGSTVQILAHGLPQLWYRAAALQSGAGAIAWAAQLTGLSVSELLRATEELDVSQRMPVFLPYLAGERTPHDNPDARGVIFGLLVDHSAGHVGRAVLRGLAFALADGYAALVNLGAMPAQLAVVGGGARSALLCRLVASILDTPLHLLSSRAVGAALGVARLALASETGQSLAALTPELGGTIVEPDRQLGDLLRQDLALYRELYQALVPSFAKLERA
ncbi:xylulokinase [Devosia sp. A369]